VAEFAIVTEIEAWEAERLEERLPAGVGAAFLRGTLADADDALRARATILAPFIHSFAGPAEMAAMPSLRLVSTRSTGFDHIDLAVARERGIVVCNVPTYGENTVAEHTFALILALSRKVHQAYVRTQRGEFTVEGLRGFDLYGKTLGVVGAGSIGLHVVRIAKGFGMRVIAYDLRRNQLLADVLGFEYVELERLLREADIITLHAPAGPATRHLIDRAALETVKRGALLINTARGSLVDTEAVNWALNEGILAGAGLDVFEGEEVIQQEDKILGDPDAEQHLRVLLGTHILSRRPEVVITPHIAFNSLEAVHRILDTTAENVAAFLAGTPQNVVPGSA
jgi:D-lactate dehydrogenase